MTTQNPSDKPTIGRIQAIIYARGVGMEQRATSVKTCEKWATCHDWRVATVVRETSDAVVPLEREGLRRALGLLETGEATVMLAASRDEIAELVQDFHAVCEAAEITGGFLHVLRISEVDGHATA